MTGGDVEFVDDLVGPARRAGRARGELAPGRRSARTDVSPRERIGQVLAGSDSNSAVTALNAAGLSRRTSQIGRFGSGGSKTCSIRSPHETTAPQRMCGRARPPQSRGYHLPVGEGGSQEARVRLQDKVTVITGAGV